VISGATKPAHETRLSGRLASRRFVVTAELGPPRAPDAELVRQAARALGPVVDAANVTDNQAATVKMSAVACAALMLDAGLEPILQMTGRDRNLLALQSELLGAWALGVRTVMALTGDPLKVGPYEGLATQVGDVDSLGLARMIGSLNAGRLLAGELLPDPTAFLVVGAANPFVDSVERLEAKLAAGVGVFQTNIVYDVERFERWFAPVVAAGITQRAPVLVGVAPPRSSEMLRFLHDRIPGVEVDDATFARMETLEGEDAEREGIALASDVIGALRRISGVAGVHLMAPGWEVDAVPRLVSAAGLGGR